jgi:RNA polymerase sigma-70 factor (ECF subfamily)
MTPAYSDEALIQDILAGGFARRRATDTFYKAHYKFIYEGKKKYNLSEEDAITAYLEAVTKVVRAIERKKFEGKSKLSTYLYKTFFNCCVDVARSSTSNRYEHDDLSSVANLADYAQDQLKDLLGSEAMGLLRRMMDKIGKKCKDLLIAIEIDGFSVEETALKLGIKPSSVPQTKYRCMEKLKLAAQSSQLF